MTTIREGNGRQRQPAGHQPFAPGGPSTSRQEVDELYEAAEEFFRSLSKAMPASVPWLHDPALTPGHRVSHYEILERIGAGGMGTVYRAHDTRLDRVVALKFLPAHLSALPDAREQLLAEARAAAALEHPNICTVYEIGESEDGRPFIAMALCEGETLQDRLRRGPVPPEEAVDIAAQIARGLKAAHARGIVHRDVKPGNVMLTAEGTVKLLDFGLAKAANVALTRPGATPGTIAYMSPEQARGDLLDPRTDLWSLGVVLYEMLTGVRPFRGGNDRAVIQAILHEVPASTERHEVPTWLARIVERLLQKDPDDRIASADELLILLEQKRVGSWFAIAPLDRWFAESALGRVAMGVAGVLAAVGLVLGIRTARDAESPIPAVDAAGAAPAIAVLPFSVHGPELEVWREGMVDLLSMGLDGAGGLRAIDSRTLLARWNEKLGDQAVADLEMALGVARQTQASYALVGSAVTAGPRVRFAADVYDLESGLSLGQAVVEGPPDSIFALVDLLGMRVLEVVFQGDRDDLPSIDLAAVTTSSLPALKAFLDGEVHFRRTEFGAAAEAWEQAIRADTLFALAYYGLAETYGWWGEDGDPDRAYQMLDRAYRLADRLPAREATMVRARWAGWNKPGGLAAAEEAARRYPDDAEALYILAEAYFHHPEALRGPEEAEHAFRRAAGLEPASALYRVHLLDLSFLWRPDSARVAHEVDAYGRLAPASARARAGRVALALAYGDAGSRVWAQAALDSLGPESASKVFDFLSHPGLAAEREAAFPAIDRRVDGGARQWLRLLRFRGLGVTDGRVREALATLDRPGTPEVLRFCGPLYLSDRGLPVPEAILAERLAAMGASDSVPENRFWITCAAGYTAERGLWREHADLRARAEGIARRELAAGDSASAMAWERAARMVEAHGLWRRGQTEQALHGFESALASDNLGWGALWYVGRLAFELDRLDQAERTFQALWQWDGTTAQIYLGRIYERTGRPAEALEAYEFVLHAWRNADPELKPLVDEARQGVTRLSGAED